MKPRSQLLACLALFFLSWNASAQVRGVHSSSPSSSPQNNRFQFGSLERTKLLQQGRAGRAKEDVLRLGAVDRRSLLTTGKSIYKKKPERHYYPR